MRVPFLILLIASLALLPGCGEDTPPAKAQPKSDAGPAPAVAQDVGAHAEAMQRGRAYLLAQVNADGSIGKGPEVAKPAMTVMAVLGLIATTPKDQVRGDPTITGAIEFLLPFQSKSGAIDEPTGKRNYITAVFVSALSMARNPAYRQPLIKAKDYLQNSQIAGAESDLSYGGFPYKQEQGQPADLSNAQYALEALKNAERAGEKVDPVVWERAQKMLARLQNRSEVNTGTFKTKIEVAGAEQEVEVVSGNDNGATYYPGNSKAGYDARDDGKYVARSYGSMTYALLKCLIFAGVDAKDPRIEGAVSWISQNWTVAYNPGFKTEKERMQGYYYYLHTASRALAEYESHSGEPLLVRDPNGAAHDWRQQMGAQLEKLQREDGSWLNEHSRWEEASPVIVTSYALQALAFVTKRLP